MEKEFEKKKDDKKKSGRPKSKEPRKEKVQIRLTEDELKKLDKLKVKYGIDSRSNLIRFILKQNEII